MLEIMKCQYCGIPVEIDVEDKPDDFNGFLKRIQRSSAACQECGEKHEKEWRELLEKRKEDQDRRQKEYEEHERLKVPRAFAGIVGRKYAETSLGTFVPRTPSQAAAHAAAKDFSASPAGFFYLHGKPGIGKTHLGVGIFREHAMTLLEKNDNGEYGPIRKRATFKEADYWTVPELLLHLRSQINEDISEEAAVEPLLRSRLLILDDLGAEKITDWVRQAFYVVISRRERDEMPTVITSNLSLGEIEARVGDDRITSRIGGAAKIIHMIGADARIAGRKP